MTCAVCHAATRDHARLCRTCTRQLEQALAELPADISDLQAVATRQAAGPLGLGRGHYCQRPDPNSDWQTIDAPTDDPWTFAPAAADQLWCVGNTLTTWIRHLCETRGMRPPAASRGARLVLPRLYVHRNRMHTRPEHQRQVFVPAAEQPLSLLAGWLLANLETIRHDEAADQLHDEILGLREENHRWTLGPAPAEEFYGLCDAPDVRVDLDDGMLRPTVGTCGVKLFGTKDAKRIDCPACGASYSRAERHASMLRELADHLGTVSQVASTLTTLGRPVTINQITGWLRRGRLTDRGGHPRLVRIGDVLAVRADVHARSTRRNATAA